VIPHYHFAGQNPRQTSRSPAQNQDGKPAFLVDGDSTCFDPDAWNLADSVPPGKLARTETRLGWLMNWGNQIRLRQEFESGRSCLVIRVSFLPGSAQLFYNRLTGK